MSGSSAPQLGIACLQALHDLGGIETHLVVSAGAVKNLEIEAQTDVRDLDKLVHVRHDAADLAAPISSGSFRTLGMLVIPCSMRTLGAIASGNTADLVSRAADVTLKERRRLVLVCRETPLNLIHLRNMETVTLAGAVVMPPVVAFYHRPSSIDELIGHIVGKALDLFDIEHDLFTRWS